MGCFKNLSMRIIFFIVSVFLCSGSFAQSLRDSLYGGKLKVDSATLAKSKVSVQKPAGDSLRKTGVDSTGKTVTDTLQKQSSPEKPALNYADNNKTWKKFIDEYTVIINTEVLTSKKIKRGTYSVMLEYEIGTDGMVTTKNVTCSPGSEYLVEQVKERMMANAPQLAPMIRDGVPRKSSKRQVINFTKEKN
jgi:hypothetical protein